jgi:hypothetical protein
LKQNTVKTLSYAVNAAVSFIVISLTSVSAQSPKPKMATHIPSEITTPDAVETRPAVQLNSADALATWDGLRRMPIKLPSCSSPITPASEVVPPMLWATWGRRLRRMPIKSPSCSSPINPALEAAPHML